MKRVGRRTANYCAHTCKQPHEFIYVSSYSAAHALFSPLPFSMFFSFTDLTMDDAVDANTEWPFRTFGEKAITIVSL